MQRIAFRPTALSFHSSRGRRTIAAGASEGLHEFPALRSHQASPLSLDGCEQCRRDSPGGHAAPGPAVVRRCGDGRRGERATSRPCDGGREWTQCTDPRSGTPPRRQHGVERRHVIRGLRGIPEWSRVLLAWHLHRANQLWNATLPSVCERTVPCARLLDRGACRREHSTESALFELQLGIATMFLWPSFSAQREYVFASRRIRAYAEFSGRSCLSRVSHYPETRGGSAKRE